MIEMLAPTETNLYCTTTAHGNLILRRRLVKSSRASFNVVDTIATWRSIISVCKLTHDTGPSRLLDVSILGAHVGAAVTERQLHDVDVVVGVDEDGVQRG